MLQEKLTLRIEKPKINTSCRTVSDMHGCNYCGDHDGFHTEDCVFDSRPAVANPSPSRQMNSYVEHLETLVNESIERLKALENRCKVAEDLNKIYVRMYLEMQQKYDDFVRDVEMNYVMDYELYGDDL